MEYIKNNLSFVKERFCYIAGSAFGLLSIVLSFFSWEDMGITSKCNRFLICIAVILGSFIVALFWLVVKRKNTLWEQGEKSIRALYGDIIKVAANKKCEKIVVVPVNTTFDTIVGNGIVSPNSMHGRWINWFCSVGHTLSEIDRLIQDDFNTRKVKPCCIQNVSEKPKGKTTMYPRGTVAVIDDDQTHYYLLALSHFDENMNAQCNKAELVNVITDLINFYNKNGQGLPIYIPLMGSGLSRANITPGESLQIITDLLKLNRDQVHGEANVIVYSKIKNQVSIFDL